MEELSCFCGEKAALGHSRVSASAVLRIHCVPELNSEVMYDLGDAFLRSWKRKQSSLVFKRLVFFFRARRRKRRTPCCANPQWESSGFAEKLSAPQSPAAHAPFQDLFSCGQRPLIQLPGNLTSTRRPALRHSRRIQPITARALPRASTPNSDTILRRITTIGWWESRQPMRRRVDRRDHQ